MKATFIINNYTLGARVKATQIEKITKQERIDRSHTLIEYSDVCQSEISTLEKVLCYRVKSVVMD